MNTAGTDSSAEAPAETSQRCGYVAIVGRPNVGKSTLMNRILGQKLSIVTAKPQTTRQRITGIKSTPGGQVVYVDTPGIHLAAKRALVTRHIELLADAYDEQALVHKLKVFTRSFSHGLPGGRALRQELSSLHRSADLVAAVERFLA